MGNEIDYYFIYGNSMDEVISGYRTLTGKAQIMPKWAMGFWQSREKYNTRRELLDVLCEFRRRRIPLDNIVIDWNHWPENAWGSHEFDLKRFPDPKGMVDSIHALNAKIMISVWPKFYTNTGHFKEFEEKGWMYMQSVRDSLRDWVGPGYRYGFYDAYDPEARKLFWKQMQDHYYPLGIDAWWMDASEPNVRDCTDMQYRKALCGPTALGPSTQYFNAYALMNAEAIYDGQRKMDPDRRVFLLTRSGFAGLQRYSTATWSGDIATRWEDMKAQISAGLNFAMSGIPYWTMDIGGFCVERRYEKAQREWNRTKKENADYKEWRELNARWYQFGAFCPLYRSHGQFPYREIWNIAPEGHPAYQSMVYYTRLRYRMMPYIYSLAGMTHFNDYTIMRALVMDFGKDKNVLDISDQFMFGPALMACPVYTYKARQRKVYFPDGNGWYDFYTGKHITGGQTLTVDAPYEQIPLYVRSGAILPYGPDLQYTDEKTASEIILYVYTGQDGAFTLYEDENENYNYEKGQYSMIPFKYDEATRSLTIGKRQGEFSGMLKERTFRIVTVSPTQMQAFDPDASGKTITYNGGKQTIRL
jgi:alpha-D-xyloside xylohydrolase